MVTIDSIAQLNLFDTIKTILKSDSVLKNKFPDRKFHEFEPNLKSLGSGDFPYIVISIPNLTSENLDFDHGMRQKDAEITIEMVMDYKARDNVRKYSNKIINLLESNEDNFTALGYNITSVEFEGATDDYIKERHSIRTTFSLTLRGAVYG